MTAAAPPRAALSEAERRQLTIMFCDLVDSVVLSTRLDPEDLRDVISAYHGACARSIDQYSGYVARYLGDGILIYFGYPEAHEDDAGRAVRAALDLVQTVARLNDELKSFPDLDLRVRIGIATGLVVVGDERSGLIAEMGTVTGEAANVAARLQALAGPNGIVVSAVTRQLAGEAFTYHDLGPQQLKGFSRPMAAYQVVGEREISRLAARSAAPTPFVGRYAEIAMLLAAWQSATAGSGRAVIITGEAGIGKSRIVAEAWRRIHHGAAGLTPALFFQCSPYHVNEPLYPIVKELQRTARLDRAAEPRENFDRLAAALADDGAAEPHSVALLGDLLGLGVDDRFTPPVAGAAAKRGLTLDAVQEWLARRAMCGGGIFIAVEDAQWADPTTKYLLGRIARWASDAPAMVVVTLRTETVTAGDFLGQIGLAEGSAAHVHICEIRELNPVEAWQLANEAGESRPLGDARLAAVLARSEGIPLYIEELVKSVVAGADLLPSDGADDGSVPNTLHDALMARLDQLGEAKAIAQHAAVLGDDFSLPLLAVVADRDAGEVAPALHQLIAEKIVVEAPAGPGLFGFRHALLRDIAYRSLLRRNRRQIHLRAAAALEGQGESATDGLIARHYSLGENYAEAVRFQQRGANAAIARSAHEEALAMLRAAATDLRKLSGEQWAAVELEVVLTQAVALRSLRGYAAPEVEERLLRARQLCIACGDTKNRFNVEWGLFQCTFVQRDIAGARRLAAGLFEHAERHPDQPLVDAWLANGMVAQVAPEYAASKRFLEAAVSLSRPETDPPHFFTHGQNPGLFSLSYLSRTLCYLGLLDQARATIEHCLAIAARRAGDPGHLYGHVNALVHAARVYSLCGDLAAEKRFAEEAQDIAQRNHFAYYEAVSRCHLGWVAGCQGAPAEGIETMLAGLVALEKTGTSLALSQFLVMLAQLYIRAARWREAAATLHRVPQGKPRWYAAVERVRGELLSRRPDSDPAAAEQAYRASLDLARRQGAGLLILKSALSLAEFLRRSERSQEARAVLVDGLAMLPEGHDVADAQRAERLLESLAQGDSPGPGAAVGCRNGAITIEEREHG
jgi:class 3 adenylate cyclase/tetratricopeptide (TPR) repeat protein